MEFLRRIRFAWAILCMLITVFLCLVAATQHGPNIFIIAVGFVLLALAPYMLSGFRFFTTAVAGVGIAVFGLLSNASQTVQVQWVLTVIGVWCAVALITWLTKGVRIGRTESERKAVSPL